MTALDPTPAAPIVAKPSHAIGRTARRLTTWGLLAALITALVTVTASPAQAATPKCNGLGYIAGTWVQDWDIEHDMVSYAPVYNPGPKMTWKCTMAPGLTNHWGVRALQQSLNSCYLSLFKTPLKIDGGYGPKTKAAVDAAQKWHKIKRDGIYGPRTAAAMYHHTWAVDRPRGAKNAPGHWGCARLGVVQSGV